MGSLATRTLIYASPQTIDAAPLYASSLWIGGTVGGEFRAAAATYGQSRTGADAFEFWPGPLGDGATLPNATDCSAYDRVWTVSASDLTAYEQSGTASTDLAEWPVGLGAPAVTAAGDPVQITSQSQTVDLGAGERPVVYGTQTAFWVMNDVGNDHRSTESAPLGVEVTVTAFVIASETLALNQASVYRYRITNHNDATIEDSRVGFWADSDIGFGRDEAVGVDLDRSMGYAYKSRDFYEIQYLSAPPAIGYDLLGGSSPSGPPALAAFLYGAGGNPNITDPYGSAARYDFALRGLWPDGTPLTANGSGYGQGGATTTFAFPADPVTGSYWSEVNTEEGLIGEFERRFWLAMAPVTLAPGESQTIDLGIVFAQGTSNLDAITRLRGASDIVQSAYDSGSLFDTARAPSGAGPAAPTLASPESGDGPLIGGVELTWTPVEGATDYLVETSMTPGFESPRAITVVEPVFVYESDDARAQVGEDAVSTVYWRVRARRGSIEGGWSQARSFVHRLLYPDVLRAVEIVGPGGADPCGPNAVSTWGCPAPGAPFTLDYPGNEVMGSPNGTGAYILFDLLYVQPRFAEALAPFAPNDYEIRFVGADAGGYGYLRTPAGTVAPVPFEVWDLGAVTPGVPNDPSDDVRMIPILGGASPSASDCSFAAFASGGDTPFLGAAYPTDSYDAFASAVASVAGGGCQNAPNGLTSFIDLARGLPLQNVALSSFQTAASAEDLTGAVIRFYTSAGSTSSETEPTGDGVVLGAPFPNPARTTARVRYRTDAAGAVRLTVVDLLGREVAPVLDGSHGPGDHNVTFDVSGLAAGAYVMVLETRGTRTSRLLTVIR